MIIVAGLNFPVIGKRELNYCAQHLKVNQSSVLQSWDYNIYSISRAGTTRTTNYVLLVYIDRLLPPLFWLFSLQIEGFTEATEVQEVCLSHWRPGFRLVPWSSDGSLSKQVGHAGGQIWTWPFGKLPFECKKKIDIKKIDIKKKIGNCFEKISLFLPFLTFSGGPDLDLDYLQSGLWS